MDNLKIERLKKKYSYSPINSNKKEFNIGVGQRRGRDGAMSAHGKPKNTLKTIARLLKYLSHERIMFLIALFCAILNTVASLLAGYLLRPIMNKYLFFDGNLEIGDRLSSLALALCTMAGVYLVGVVSHYLQQRIMLSVSQKSLRRMRSDLMNKLQKLPIKFFDGRPVGDIMSLFTNDVDVVAEMLNTTLIQIVSGAITIVGTIILMLYTNLILGGITIIMAPILTIVGKKIIKHGRKAYREQQKNIAIMGGFSEEMITGQKVVKVFNHEDQAIEEFDYINGELVESQIKAQFQSGIMGPVTHQLCNATYAISACVGGVLVAIAGFDIGGLAVSLNYTRRFNMPINEISMQMNTVFSALAGAERVFNLLDMEEEEQDSNIVNLSKITGHVILENVSFGYIENHPVLHDISFYAKPGQKIAFVGSTGAGKTTVTNLLSRFYEIDKGKITIDGIDIEKIDKSFLRSNIAMVLQDTHLFTDTIMENIRYGRLDATDEEVIEASKTASAHQFIMGLKNGYDTMIENDGANLSQGQRQLLNIARVAISKAPILILDEATSSVDTRTEKHIEQGMDAIMENRTTLVIAHRLSTVRKANCIMVLEKGRIIERGTHEELLEINGRYSDLYNEIAELE